ncbi:MAG TPA: PrsW family glutamic-type intramembrane protease [Alphaproteobacteria bacterium]|nr:PrsW family glutamic-type intramembrane protease [Alphaproteobacteria bacterium]
MDLALRFAALVSALAPICLLALFFYARAGGRVSAELIGLGMMFGAISTFFPLGFALLLQLAGWDVSGIGNVYLRGIARAFLMAALPEELAKLCVLLLVVMRHEFCDRPEDVLVGSIAVALGFAACENVFYLFTALENGRLAIIGSARAAITVPMHAIDGVFMGLFVSGLVKSGSPARQILTGLGVVILLHGLYDAPLMIAGNFSNLRTWQELILPGGLLAFFLLFTIVVGALGLRWLRFVTEAMPSSSQDADFWHRLLLSRWLWRVIGVCLLLFGVGAFAYAGWSFAHKDAQGAIFLIHGFVPILFGLAMLRLTPRGAKAA